MRSMICGALLLIVLTILLNLPQTNQQGQTVSPGVAVAAGPTATSSPTPTPCEECGA